MIPVRKCQVLLFSITFLIIVFAFPVLSMGQQKCEKIKPVYERNCGSLKPTSLQRFKEIGECYEIEVRAASPWNASGLLFRPEEKYEIKVIDEKPIWKDGSIDDVPPTGWDSDHPSLDGESLIKLFLLVTEPFRRDSEQNWFYLMGATASVEYRQFPIGTSASYESNVVGEFCAFANDLHWKYDNNYGALNIRVTRVSK